jgi:hypothetical protein
LNLSPIIKSFLPSFFSKKLAAGGSRLPYKSKFEKPFHATSSPCSLILFSEKVLKKGAGKTFSKVFPRM